MSRLTRDGTTAEPVSRDQILRRERGQGNIHFPCSADHEQDWQPYSVDPYSLLLYVSPYITENFERRPTQKTTTVPGIVYNIIVDLNAGRPRSSEVPRNPLTRWDVSSIPANNGIFLTKKIKTKTKKCPTGGERLNR